MEYVIGALLLISFVCLAIYAVRGGNLMIGMLIKGLSSQAQRSEQDERMLCLLQKDANYVSEENLTDVLAWYEALKE